jgi:hypothetical protein
MAAEHELERLFLRKTAREVKPGVYPFAYDSLLDTTEL